MSMRVSTGPEPAADWAAIAAVILGITAFAAAQGLTYPLISLILERRGVSETLIGLNAGAFALGLAAATLLIGRLTARVAGDRLILVGLVGAAASLAALAASESYLVWCLARFSLGFFASLIFVLSEAWLGVACPDRLRGRVAGVYGAGMSGGFAAGPLAIPIFGTEDGFGFAILAIYVAFVAFASALLCRAARTRPEPAPPGGLAGFARAAPALLLMVLAFGVADIASIATMPVYFVQTGHSEAFAALSVTAMALPTAIAQPAVGVLLDRYSRPRIAVACGLVAAASFLAIPLIAEEVALLAVFALLGAAAFGLYTCALTMLGERYAGGALVAGSAAFTLAYALGSAAGSSATGAAMDAAGPIYGPIAAGGALIALTAAFAAAGRPSRVTG